MQKYLESLGAIPVTYEEDVQKSLLSVAPKPITKFLDCYGGDYVKLAFHLGLNGTDIGTLVPSPFVMIKGAQFTGPRHSTYDDLRILEDDGFRWKSSAKYLRKSIVFLWSLLERHIVV